MISTPAAAPATNTGRLNWGLILLSGLVVATRLATLLSTEKHVGWVLGWFENDPRYLSSKWLVIENAPIRSVIKELLGIVGVSLTPYAWAWCGVMVSILVVGALWNLRGVLGAKRVLVVIYGLALAPIMLYEVGVSSDVIFIPVFQAILLNGWIRRNEYRSWVIMGACWGFLFMAGPVGLWAALGTILAFTVARQMKSISPVMDASLIRWRGFLAAAALVVMLVGLLQDGSMGRWEGPLVSLVVSRFADGFHMWSDGYVRVLWLVQYGPMLAAGIVEAAYAWRTSTDERPWIVWFLLMLLVPLVEKHPYPQDIVPVLIPALLMVGRLLQIRDWRVSSHNKWLLFIALYSAVLLLIGTPWAVLRIDAALKTAQIAATDTTFFIYVILLICCMLIVAGVHIYLGKTAIRLTATLLLFIVMSYWGAKSIEPVHNTLLQTGHIINPSIHEVTRDLSNTLSPAQTEGSVTIDVSTRLATVVDLDTKDFARGLFNRGCVFLYAADDAPPQGARFLRRYWLLKDYSRWLEFNRVALGDLPLRLYRWFFSNETDPVFEIKEMLVYVKT